MHDINKTLRPWLESWGAWRRIKLNIDYPIESVSCNPDLHIATPIPEPSFRMPVYNDRLTPEENAARVLNHEKMLREYYHIKRSETKPQRTSRPPDYDPHWRMNLIDRAIEELPPPVRDVIKLRYEHEYKVKEIPEKIGRSIDAVHKRFAKGHRLLRYLPHMLSDPDRYSKLRKNCNNQAAG